ncbi:MAG: hypothetical protein AAGC97_19895 [Planctomycetota bacterium]
MISEMDEDLDPVDDKTNSVGGGVLRLITYAGLMILMLAAISASIYRRYIRIGPKTIEVVEAMRPQFDLIRATLVEAVDPLRHEPLVRETVWLSAPDEVIHWLDSDEESENATLIAMSSIVDMPNTALSDVVNRDLVFLYDNRDFSYSAALAWTAPETSLSRSVWNDRGSGIKRELEAATAVRYVFLGRLDPPLAQSDGDGLEIGQPVLGEVVLVDVKLAEVLARIPVEGPALQVGRDYPTLDFADDVRQQIKSALDDRAELN